MAVQTQTVKSRLKQLTPKQMKIVWFASHTELSKRENAEITDVSLSYVYSVHDNHQDIITDIREGKESFDVPIELHSNGEKFKVTPLKSHIIQELRKEKLTFKQVSEIVGCSIGYVSIVNKEFENFIN